MLRHPAGEPEDDDRLGFGSFAGRLSSLAQQICQREPAQADAAGPPPRILPTLQYDEAGNVVGVSAGPAGEFPVGLRPNR